MALNWALWRLADIPVRPSIPEMAVSKLFLSSTFPRSPTRDGSSPFSSPANVFGQLRSPQHMIRFSLLSLVVSITLVKRIGDSHSLLVSTILSPRIVPQSPQTSSSAHPMFRDQIAYKISLGILFDDIRRISPTIRAEVFHIQIR